MADVRESQATRGGRVTSMRMSFADSTILNQFKGEKFAYLWDYVMVFNMIDTRTADEHGDKIFKQTKTCKGILASLRSRGVHAFTYPSVQGDEIYCLLRVKLARLREFADKIGFTLEMDPSRLEALFTGCEKVNDVKRSESEQIAPLTLFRNKFKFGVRMISSGEELVGQGIEQPSKIGPFDLIFLPYDKETPCQLYKHDSTNSGAKEKKRNEFDKKEEHEPAGCLFSYTQRLKLTYYYLKASQEDGGCGIQIEKLLLEYQPKPEEVDDDMKGFTGGIIKAFYPLHNREEAKEIYDKSLAWEALPWSQPFDQLRTYFGEKLTLFYVFHGHYSYWLVFPAVLGLIFQIVVLHTNDYSHPVLCFLGLIISIWSISMLQYWKRSQSYQAMKWGMMSFEETEPDRPEYYGMPIHSMVTGERILYFPEKVKETRMFASVLVVSSFIMLVVGVVSGIYILRRAIASSGDKEGKVGSFDGDTLSGLVAGVLNSLQIYVLNVVYLRIVQIMTDQENCRTDTAYEDSLIAKLFVFQFVNSYASFFYIAFIAQFMPLPRHYLPGDIGQCGGPTCMIPLSLNLAIVFGTRITVNNLLEWYFPWQAQKDKQKKETEGVSGVLTPPEEDYMLTVTDPMVISIQNYADSAIQFGYVTMFVTALPSAPFFALLSNYIMVKVHTLKLTKFFQRPVPQGTEDIGTWETIFNVLALVCVVTNAGLVAFTMDILQRGTTKYVAGKYSGSRASGANFTALVCVWIFVGFSVFMFIMQYLCDIFIPDEPHKVTLQKERIEFFRSKVTEKEPDELPDVVTVGVDDDDDDDGDDTEETKAIKEKAVMLEWLKRENVKIQAILQNKSGYGAVSQTESDFTIVDSSKGCCGSTDFYSKMRPFDYNGKDVELSTTDYWMHTTQAAFADGMHQKNKEKKKPAAEGPTEVGLEMQSTPNPLLVHYGASGGGGGGGERTKSGGTPQGRRSETGPAVDVDPASAEFAQVYGGGP